MEEFGEKKHDHLKEMPVKTERSIRDQITRRHDLVEALDSILYADGSDYNNIEELITWLHTSSARKALKESVEQEKKITTAELINMLTGIESIITEDPLKPDETEMDRLCNWIDFVMEETFVSPFHELDPIIIEHEFESVPRCREYLIEIFKKIEPLLLPQEATLLTKIQLEKANEELEEKESEIRQSIYQLANKSTDPADVKLLQKIQELRKSFDSQELYKYNTDLREAQVNLSNTFFGIFEPYSEWLWIAGKRQNN